MANIIYKNIEIECNSKELEELFNSRKDMDFVEFEDTIIDYVNEYPEDLNGYYVGLNVFLRELDSDKKIVKIFMKEYLKLEKDTSDILYIKDLYSRYKEELRKYKLSVIKEKISDTVSNIKRRILKRKRDIIRNLILDTIAIVVIVFVYFYLHTDIHVYIIKPTEGFCHSKVYPGLEISRDGYTYTKLQGKHGWNVRVEDILNTETPKKAPLLKINGEYITSMESMFENSDAEKIDISEYDTSHITNMSRMFKNTAATEIIIGKQDSEKVTNMESMFENSSALILDLKGLKTSSVTTMRRMFADSDALIIDTTYFYTMKVKDMSEMFSNASILATHTISYDNFDVDNVSNAGSLENAKYTKLDLWKEYCHTKYITMRNFSIEKTNINDMFKISEDRSELIKVYIKEEETYNALVEQKYYKNVYSENEEQQEMKKYNFTLGAVE